MGNVVFFELRKTKSEKGEFSAYFGGVKVQSLQNNDVWMQGSIAGFHV